MNHVTKFAHSAHKMWLSNLGMSHLTTNTRKHNFAAKLFEIIVVVLKCLWIIAQIVGIVFTANSPLRLKN